MDDDVKGILGAIAHILHKQYEINATLWTSVQAVVASLKDADPAFEARFQLDVQAAKIEFGRQTLDIMRLIDRIGEDTSD